MTREVNAKPMAEKQKPVRTIAKGASSSQGVSGTPKKSVITRKIVPYINERVTAQSVSPITTSSMLTLVVTIAS